MGIQLSENCSRCHRQIIPQIQYLNGGEGHQMDYHGWICPTSIGSFNFGQFFSHADRTRYAVCVDCWVDADGVQPFNQRYTTHCPQCVETEKFASQHPGFTAAGALSPGGPQGEHRFHLWGWRLCPVHWKVCESWIHQFDEFRKKTGTCPLIGDIVQALDKDGDWKDLEVTGICGHSIRPDLFSFEGRFIGGELPLLLTVGHLNGNTGKEVVNESGIYTFYKYAELAWWRKKQN